MHSRKPRRSMEDNSKLSLIGIIFRWGFLIWELIFIYCGLFSPHLGNLCVVSSFTTFRPNFTSGLLQVILPRPRIGMLSLVTVSPVITAFHSCCRSHHVFDPVNLWPAWVGFETAIFWQCSPGTAQTQRLYPLRHGPRRVTVSLTFNLRLWQTTHSERSFELFGLFQVSVLFDYVHGIWNCLLCSIRLQLTFSLLST